MTGGFPLRGVVVIARIRTLRVGVLGFDRTLPTLIKAGGCAPNNLKPPASFLALSRARMPYNVRRAPVQG
jgi:hypothetical protein